MYDLKRILICLDLTDHDRFLIKAASHLHKLGVADTIYFMYVAPELDISDDVLATYPTLAAPPDEGIQRVLADEISQHFEGNADNYTTIVSEGNRFDQIMKWSRIKLVDLIVMGKKSAEIASFELPEKIIKLIHTSVLLVPAFDIKPISKLLVPVDFSKNSVFAISQALDLKKMIGSEIVCMNIYRVPSGYHTTGKSFEEFAQIMKKNAEKEFQNYLALNNIEPESISCVYVLEDGSAAEQIHQVAKDIDASGIIMGSKGRTQISNLVLGSTAMKMVKHEFQIPVLIVKDKTHNMSLMEAILKI